MADTPVAAIRKVVLAIQRVVRRQNDHLSVFVDRSMGEPLTKEEWPGVVLHAINVEFGRSPELGQYIHRATLRFTCQNGGAGQDSIDDLNQAVIADIILALMADPTLGGMIEDIEPIASDSSEPESPDAGAAVLMMRATFYTPVGDLFTIVGAGGQLIP